METGNKEKIETIDQLDRKILFELDHNSRQSLSSLSRKLRQGRDRVSYRISRLEERGIIKNCGVTINPYRLGITLYKTYLKIEKSKQHYQEFLVYLRKHPRVYWLADCDGRWDLIFSIFARSPFEFHKIQSDILSHLHNLVIAFNVFTLVNVWMFRKNYFVGAGRGSFFIGGSPSKYHLEALEWRILKLLAEDARISLVAIAERLKSTEMIIRNRIEKLEGEGIIAGYRIDVDLKKLGMTFFKAQLYLREDGRVSIPELREYCANHPHITYYIEQIGECELELELEVRGYEQFSEIINDLRNAFPKLIRNVETNLIREQWFRWVPFEQLEKIDGANNI